MSARWLDYLRREHARLDAAVADARRRPEPDELEIARLRALRLAVREQLADWERLSKAAAAA
ncbi:MAG TPA: YdcH family protein [Allosphingosinicella sp.]|nr:YdcH family protein [Allosphingosinicella sp.]